MLCNCLYSPDTYGLFFILTMLVNLIWTYRGEQNCLNNLICFQMACCILPCTASGSSISNTIEDECGYVFSFIFFIFCFFLCFFRLITVCHGKMAAENGNFILYLLTGSQYSTQQKSAQFLS